MYEPSQEFLTTHVAGFAHWSGFEVMDKLVPGAKLRLVAEPDNPYDPNAVAVYKGKTKIGYVPRVHNAALALLLHYGHGRVFRCCVVSVDPTVHPERMVHMRISVRDAR